MQFILYLRIGPSQSDALYLFHVVDITMVFLTFIGIFDFVFHLVELSRVDERGLLLLNLPYRTVPGIYC